MNKLTKAKIKSSISKIKNIIRNSSKVVSLLMVAILAIEAFNDKEVIASESISVNNKEVIKINSDFNDYSDDGNSKNGENINADTNKQNLIYTSYENDLYSVILFVFLTKQFIATGVLLPLPNIFPPSFLEASPDIL